MKTSLRPLVAWLRPALLAAAALGIAGCLQERITWSPDGRRAAVVTADGLHFVAPDGRITPLLIPGAYRAAWLPDSRQLVLARRKPVRNFAELSAALGAERTRTLIQKSEQIGRKLPEMSPNETFKKRLTEEIGEDLSGIVAYLREQPQHLATLRRVLGPDWKKEDETKPVDLNEVVVTRLKDDGLEIVSSLFVGLPEVHALRVSPGGRAVAFTLGAELSLFPDNGVNVQVAPTDGSAPAEIVATQSTTHPDWSPDGRSLVYFKASGSAGSGDDLRLGSLVQRDVLDASGHVRPAADSTDLAGLILHQHNRVRSLRDGRVIFNASPLQLPTTGANDTDREQLFLFARTPAPRIFPLIPADRIADLPKTLSSFEVSPDERQILICSDSAEAWVFTLATGTLVRIAPKLESDQGRQEGENYPAPAWRAAGEITFLRRTATAPGSSDPHAFELVLRRGDSDTVLSRSWAPGLLRRLID